MKPRKTEVAIVVAMVALAAEAGVLGAAGPQGASPGALERVALVEGRCPTFVWQPGPGAAYHELVVYELAAPPLAATNDVLDLSEASEVLYTQVPGTAPAWTPEVAQCLAPGGRYAWFVRAVLDEETEDASEWSEPRLFAVTPAPSVAEVEAALDVLRRYRAASRGDAATVGDRESRPEVTARDFDVPAAAVESAKSASRSVLTGVAAIRGEQPDVSREAYGLVGISGSLDGAGVGAANTAGGADLVLDGRAQRVADTVLTESGIDRPATSAQTFTLANSGGGGITFEVAGTIAGDGSLLTGITAADVRCEGCVAGDDLALGTVGTSQLADAAVTATKIARGAVTNDAIAAGAVGVAEIASGAVTTDRLRDRSVTSPKIANDAVTMNAIAANAVGASEIAPNAVGSTEIMADAVTASEIASGAVGSSEIATDAVRSSEIAADAVGSSEIASGAVDTSEIADNAIYARHFPYLIARVVECNGECGDSQLSEVCGSGRHPIAVTCNNVEEQDNFTFNCGGDNECSGYYLHGDFPLDSFCEDGGGWDAIVFCWQE